MTPSCNNGMQALFLENLTSIWVIKSLWGGPAHCGGREGFIWSPLTGPSLQVSGDGTTPFDTALDPVRTLQNVTHLLHEWPAEWAAHARAGTKERGDRDLPSGDLHV